MPDTVSRIIAILLYVLLGISAILIILFYAGGYTAESVDAVYPEPKYTQIILFWAYILVILTALLAIGIPLIRGILNPKNITKALVPIIATLSVVLIAYLLSSDKPMRISTGLEEDPLTLRYSDTMLITVYILTGLAILSIVYSLVAGLFKKV